MGIHDRDYLREEPPPGAMRGPQSMVVTIIMINGAVFLANLFFGGGDEGRLMYALSADVYSLIRPWNWWQLVTSGFAHDPRSINHILFNMLGLFFLGRFVEQLLGRWEFLRFYLVAIVAGCVVHLTRVYFFVPEVTAADGSPLMNPNENPWAVPLLGASAGVTATVLLFIFKFPKEKLLLFFAIPVPAWAVGVLIVASDMVGAGLFRSIIGEGVMSARVAYDAHLAGAAFAFLYFWFGWNFGRWVPARAGRSAGGWEKMFTRQPKLRVHTPDAESESKYAKDDAEADRLLVKIEREGLDSLTPRERKIMDDYSRRMQQKHR